MVDTAISNLATLGALTDTDLFAVVDDVGGTPVTQSVRADVIRALVAGGFTATGAINLADQVLQRPTITDFGITHSTAFSLGGVLTLDMAVANSYDVTLTQPITNINITNAPASGTYGGVRVRFIQSGTTARTITYGSEFLFPSGVHHIMSAALSSVDRVYFETYDGGSTFDCTFVNGLS